MDKQNEEEIKQKRLNINNLLKVNTNFMLIGIGCLVITSILAFILGCFEALIFVIFMFYLWIVKDKPLNEFIFNYADKLKGLTCGILETILIGVILFICAIGLYFFFGRRVTHFPG